MKVRGTWVISITSHLKKSGMEMNLFITESYIKKGSGMN
jgi:hypothetical protein